MKKKYILLLVLLLLIVGCQSKKQEEPKDKSKMEIELENNSSAGMRWDYFISEEGIIEINKTYNSGGCPDDAVGCGGYDVYKIKALKEGQTTITFNHVDHNDFVTEEIKYVINVDENLNISSKESRESFEEE